MPLIADLAWVAGIIDGEGCISIQRGVNRRTGRENYFLHVAVSNTMYRMIEHLRDLYPKSHLEITPAGTYGRRKMSFKWIVASRRAADLLREVRPYVIAKRDQVDIALAFADRAKRPGQHLNAAEYQERRRMYDSLKSLHQRSDTEKVGS